MAYRRSTGMSGSHRWSVSVIGSACVTMEQLVSWLRVKAASPFPKAGTRATVRPALSVGGLGKMGVAERPEGGEVS